MDWNKLFAYFAKHKKLLFVVLATIFLASITAVDLIFTALAFFIRNPFWGILFIFTIIFCGILIFAIKTDRLDEVLNFTQKTIKPTKADISWIKHTYKELGAMLFQIQKKSDFLKVTELLSVDSVTELRNDRTYSIKSGYTLYYYSLMTSSAEPDISLIKEVLQKKIVDYLMGEALNDNLDVPTRINYSGAYYPAILVHKVVYRGGKSVEIVLTVTTDEYLNVQSKKQKKLLDNEEHIFNDIF